MAIVISGTNNNDKITATDGLIDVLSGVSFNSEVTVPSFKVGSNIQLGNAGIITATTLVGNVTGNINHTSNLLLQISGSEKFRVGTSGQLGIGGANYGSSGQVLTSGGSGSAATWSTIASDKITEGTTEAEVVDTGSDGHFKVTTEGGERVRVGPAGQIGIAGANYGTSGQVLTSGGASGAVSWSTVSGTTINSNADNRIITGSGTANTLNGESTLTYSGDTLLSTNSNFVIKSIDTNASNSENYIQFNAGYITYDSDSSNSTGYSGHYFQADGSEVLRINGSGQLIFNADTNTYISRPAADTFAFTTNGTERLRILSNGGIGVNHSNPRGQFVINSTKNALVNANCNDPHHFHLSLKNEDENNTAIGLCFSHDSTIDRVGAAIIHQRSGNGSVGDMRFYTCASEGTTSERMRITSAGEVCIASSQVNNSAKLNIAANGNHITCKSHATGGYYSIYFRSANTNVGNIYFNSGGTQYNTGSDYRLKQNIVSLTGAIDRIKTLSPKRFNFISESGVTRDGFLAHEVTTVPEAITGTKDAISTADDVAVGISTYVGEPIYQTIDQSKLVPLLTAAIQEAIAKIEILETKVAVLEGS